MLAMAAILHRYGIASRATAILSTRAWRERNAEANIYNHAILEVFNTDTRCWELHDPTFNVGYGVRTRENPIRLVSAYEFFMADPNDLCYDNGLLQQVSDAEEAYKKKRLEQYYFPLFSNIVVTNYLSHNAVGMIRTDQEDMDFRFDCIGQRNYVEFLNWVYRKPVLMGWDKGQHFTLPPLTEGFSFSSWRGHAR